MTKSNLFSKILIANRGEIAVRIIKSAQKLGIETVVIYSPADVQSLFVRIADEAYPLHSNDLLNSYLDIDKIIEIAKKTHCDAIHPGYGFLSENPKFAAACEQNGICFIGPNSSIIERMGNKVNARLLAKQIGVPISEGLTGSIDEILANANTLEYPLLIKAAAGGGGKGMKVIYHAAELAEALESTARMAKSFFGDASVFVEKYLVEPRHIEFQVFGDNFGNVVHLFERECSLQRRYQKIIEESPSISLSDDLRRKMGESAVKIAKAIEYNNAGTIEFLLDKSGKYYFLEMNTRIQVEHPVTEMVVGVDLVEEQIRVASNFPLRFNQNDIVQKGHAIEARIYAENPSNNFSPSPGNISLYQTHVNSNIRYDSSIDKPCTIHSFYDPMIAKVIAFGQNREEARLAMKDALAKTHILGIDTNVNYLIGLLNAPNYIQNLIYTTYCDSFSDEIIEKQDLLKNEIDHRMIASAFMAHNLESSRTTSVQSIWQNIGFWRNSMPICLSIDGSELNVLLHQKHQCCYQFEFNDVMVNIDVIAITNNSIEFAYAHKKYKAFQSFNQKGQSLFSLNGFVFTIFRHDQLPFQDDTMFHAMDEGESEGLVVSPMHGKITKIAVKNGESVKKGQVLLIVEAMKMENNVLAPNDAVIGEIKVKVGDMVDPSKVLIEFKDMEDME